MLGPIPSDWHLSIEWDTFVLFWELLVEEFCSCVELKLWVLVVGP